LFSAVAVGCCLYMLLIFQGSLFLAISTLISLFFSFAITILIVKAIIRINYYGEINVAIIFVVLGITVEDYFVFIDYWKKSKREEAFKEVNIKIIMAHAWR
jgi:hypothetical protein